MSMSETNTPTPIGAGTAALSETTAAEAHAAQQAARAELQVLSLDTAFREKYLSGDRAAREAMDRLHKMAYPPPGESQGTVLQPSPGPGAAPGPENAPMSPVEAPRPLDYRLFPPPGVEIKVADAQAVAEAMSAAGLPAAIGSGIWNEGVRLYEANGRKPLDADALELGRHQARAQLIERHGEDGAAEIVKAARAVIAGAVKRNPNVAGWLTISGAGNSIWVIESLANLATKRSA